MHTISYENNKNQNILASYDSVAINGYVIMSLNQNSNKS